MSGRTGELRRTALRRAGAAVALVMACFPCASAAQPEDLRRYAHTSWRVRDGAPGAVRHLAQGADGVLWIGSERGLFHFDGVRYERYEPPGQAPMSHGVYFLRRVLNRWLTQRHRGTERQAEISLCSRCSLRGSV